MSVVSHRFIFSSSKHPSSSSSSYASSSSSSYASSSSSSSSPTSSSTSISTSMKKRRRRQQSMEYGQARLETLPPEITYRIWSMLDGETLLVMGAVCRRWFYLDRDVFFWRSVVEQYQKEWKSFLGTPISVGGKKSKNVYKKKKKNRNSLKLFSSKGKTRQEPLGCANTDWKRCFARQISAQQELLCSTLPQARFPEMLTEATRRRASEQSYKVYRCPVFGSGLGVSAKSLVYPMMSDHSSPFVRAGLYSGVNGVGAGVGVRVERGVELNLCALYCYVRTLVEDIRSFFAKAHAFIFVLNPRRSEENLASARGLLHALFFFHGSCAPVSRGPLLVVCLSPPNEPPEMAALPSLTPLDVVKELQIERLPCRSFHVVFLNDLNRGHWSSTQMALRWLVSQI